MLSLKKQQTFQIIMTENIKQINFFENVKTFEKMRVHLQNNQLV